MINRKIVWLSIMVITIISAGCSQNDVAVEENELTVLHTHQVNKVSHFALDSHAYGLKIDDETAPPTMEFEVVQLMEEQGADRPGKSDRFINELISAQNDVSDIWENDFFTLYQTYLNDQAYIIEDENLRLSERQLEEIAIQIEMLHTQYADLEQNLNDLEVPKAVAEDNMNIVEAAIEEISMAIENRTLALIEFKSLYQSEDYEKHNELLDIHVGNSDKYLSQADETISELVAEVGGQ